MVGLAPRHAVTWLSLDAKLTGVQYILWAMPEGERKTTNEFYPFHRGNGVDMAGLVIEFWRMLDHEVDALLNPQTIDKEYHKVRARAFAEVLAPIMIPHFYTADQIVKESLARYKARQEGDEDYETPGMGTVFVRPYKMNKLSDPAGVLAHKKANTSSKQIPESSVASSRRGIESGMFTVAQIAKMYDTSEAAVKAQLGLA